MKPAFSIIYKYKDVVKKGAILEIGSDRNEGSTAHFHSISLELNVPFYSVDCHPESYNRAKAIIGDKAYNSTGEVFCSHIQHIDPTLLFSYAFLDNFDFLVKDFKWEHEQEIRMKYAEIGMEMNNENSQLAHYTQTVLLQPYLTSDAIIGFDDTWQTPRKTFDGKGGTAVPWLLDKGFKLIEQSPIGENMIMGYVFVQRMS